MKGTKRMVLLALFIAQALVLSIIESWIPIPQPIPGIKLGLANIITMTVIVFFGFRDTIIVVILRCLLSSIYTGGFVMFLFSVSGGIFSAIIMSLAYKKMSKLLSIIGVSILGAIAHNIGQVVMASVIMKDLSVIMYLPVLMFSGIIMGCFVGLSSNYIINALKKTKILS